MHYFYPLLKIMKRDNLELLNFTKSQIFEKQKYNIVENIIYLQYETFETI